MDKNRLEYITCYTGTIENDKLYLVHEGLGLLIQYDLYDYSYKILTKIELEKEKQPVRVRGIAILKNVIYMTFECNWNVLEYHMDTGEISLNENMCVEDAYAVERTFIHKNDIWMFPCYLNEAIRVFDIKNKTYDLKKSIGEYLKENGYYIEKTCFGDYASSGNGIVYAISYESHYIISINMQLNTYEVFDIGEEKKIARIVYDGKGYWLSFSNNGMIARWNPMHGIEKQYMVNDIEVDERGLPIHYVYESKYSLVIIPSYMQKIIVMNKVSKKFTYIEYPYDYKRINANTRRYQFYEEFLYKNYIIALPFSVNKLLKFNIDSGDTEFIEIKLNKTDIENYMLQQELKDRVITEMYGYGVKEFIEYMEKKY